MFIKLLQDFPMDEKFGLESKRLLLPSFFITHELAREQIVLQIDHPRL